MVSDTSSFRAASAWKTLEAFACRIEANIQEHIQAWTAALSTLYFALVIAISWVRLFWFDELLAFWFCRFKSFSHLWSMLKSPIEGNPPLFYLITRLLDGLPVKKEIALRVPGMLGYWVAAIAVYKFTRRRTSPLFALLAAIFPCVTFAFYYSSEARPYGMVLGCSALSLLFWQQAVETDGRRRGLALAAMGLTLAFAVSIHYYAALMALPIAAGELVRFLERRKPDWHVWITLAAGASVELLYLSLIRNFLHIHKSPHEWNRPETGFLWGSYKTILGVTLIPVPVVLSCLLLVYSKRKKGPSGSSRSLLPGHEMAACVALALLPMVAYAAAQTVIGMLHERYIIETVIGLSILFALAVDRLSIHRRSIGLALLSAVVATMFVLQYRNLHYEYMYRNYFRQFDSAAVARSLGLPITTEDTHLMLVLDYYGPREFTSRFVMAADPEVVRYYGISDTDHNIYLSGKGILPVRVERFQDFLQHNDRFLIFGGPLGWIGDYVVKRGARVEIVLQTNRELLLLVTQHPRSDHTADVLALRSVSGAR